MDADNATFLLFDFIFCSFNQMFSRPSIPEPELSAHQLAASPQWPISHHLKLLVTTHHQGNIFLNIIYLLVVTSAVKLIVSHSVFTITEKAPTRALSWLKAPTSAFTFKTLLIHYAKEALTPQEVDVKLGHQSNYHFNFKSTSTCHRVNICLVF